MMCEQSARKLLPAIRRQLVTELVKSGRKQNEIASILNITPAAVTQYVKGRRAKIELNASEKREVVKIAAKMPLDDSRICELCKKMQKRFSV